MCIFVGISGRNNVSFTCCADLEKYSFSDMIQSEAGFPKKRVIISNRHMPVHSPDFE